MTVLNRLSARLTLARPFVRRGAAWLAIGTVALVPALSQERTGSAASNRDQTWRELLDRPVAGFSRGPAGLLLTPAEHAAYARITDRVERLKFVERFWFDVAANCPAGENPVRDGFWNRAETAHDKYENAGIPGWATDPGRVLLLAGTPDTERDATARIDETTVPARIWEWDDADGGISSVVFSKGALGWRIVGLNVDVSGDPVVLRASDVPSLDAATRTLAAAFRESGCRLTPDAMAGVGSRGWRVELFDEIGRLLAGEPPAADGSLDPAWLFFPAENGATFSTVSFSLDKRPPEGTRLVVMLRDEEAAGGAQSGVYLLGTGDAEFEYRESGKKIIARAARSLPPGRYKSAAGWLDANDEIRIGHAGSQIVARVTDESLRLTSILLASQLEKVDASAPGPFTLGGYSFTPTLGNEFRRGDTFYMLFQAVGATANASGQADVTVKYTLHGKHPQRGWMAIGAPQTETNPGGVRVREVPIPQNYPPTDYKWEIEVKDNATGQSVSKEVRFTVLS